MNTDPITGLREAVTIDATLRAELLAAASYEEAVEIAGRSGWTITAAEIEALAREFTIPERELSDAELEQVSGGKYSAVNETMSNISKTRSEISQTFARNARA